LATGQSRAAAADQLDQLVTRLLTTMREGKPAKLPGLGELRTTSGKPARLVPASREESR
jgi:hypothetical protein